MTKRLSRDIQVPGFDFWWDAGKHLVYNSIFCDKMSWAKTNVIADLALKRSNVRDSNESDKRIC